MSKPTGIEATLKEELVTDIRDHLVAMRTSNILPTKTLRNFVGKCRTPLNFSTPPSILDGAPGCVGFYIILFTTLFGGARLVQLWC